MKREAAVTKEMNAKLSDDKKISRKEKDERILWKKNEVAEYESTTFRWAALLKNEKHWKWILKIANTQLNFHLRSPKTLS